LFESAVPTAGGGSEKVVCPTVVPQIRKLPLQLTQTKPVTRANAPGSISAILQVMPTCRFQKLIADKNAIRTMAVKGITAFAGMTLFNFSLGDFRC
jgi:hypothetical protein